MRFTCGNKIFRVSALSLLFVGGVGMAASSAALDDDQTLWKNLLTILGLVIAGTSVPVIFRSSSCSVSAQATYSSSSGPTSTPPDQPVGINVSAGTAAVSDISPREIVADEPVMSVSPDVTQLQPPGAPMLTREMLPPLFRPIARRDDPGLDNHKPENSPIRGYSMFRM